MSLFQCFHVAGYDLHYVDTGQGTPMVMLHNGGGFMQIWQHQIEHFSLSYRVIAMDWAGFGESSEAQAPLTVDLYLSHLEAFLDHLHLESLVLVGNCIGASVAVAYQQRHPDRVRSLILFNMCPGERMIRLSPLRYLLFRLGQKGWIHTLLWKVFAISLQIPLVSRRFPRILFGREYDPDSPLAAAYRAKYLQARQTSGRLHLLFGLQSFTLRHFLKAPVPADATLLIWGENNRVVSFGREALYHQTLLGLDACLTVPGGHLCMYEYPKIVHSAMESHLARCQS